MLNITVENFSIGCHCPRHGEGCRINKVARKRPVGYFLAWLLEGQTIDSGPEYKDNHMSKRLEFAVGGAVDFDSRHAARQLGLADAELEELFAWEELQGDHESSHVEPETVR